MPLLEAGFNITCTYGNQNSQGKLAFVHVVYNQIKSKKIEGGKVTFGVGLIFGPKFCRIAVISYCILHEVASQHCIPLSNTRIPRFQKPLGSIYPYEPHFTAQLTPKLICRLLSEVPRAHTKCLLHLQTTRLSPPFHNFLSNYGSRYGFSVSNHAFYVSLYIRPYRHPN
jgi:hypothetical protein